MYHFTWNTPLKMKMLPKFGPYNWYNKKGAFIMQLVEGIPNIVDRSRKNKK